MHRLSSGNVSLDSSVVVDFYRTGNLELLRELFPGRMLMSDFVERELAEAAILLPEAEVVPLADEDEWQFLEDVRKSKSGLGMGELGALTTARSRRATLLTNDKQARQTVEELQFPVSGAIGILEFATEVGRLSGNEAVKILEEMICEGAWISEDLVELFRQRVFERE